MMAILLLGLLLRAAPLDQNRLMEDEALYGYWALQIATASNPILDREPVDKPPLFPYTLALNFSMLGPRHALSSATTPASDPGQPVLGGPLACATAGCRAEVYQLELVARLPSLFSGTVTIALVYALGIRLYGSRKTGLLAALLTALSPFAVLYSSTAFVDPFLTAWVSGALLAASAGQIGAAGLLVGLAASSKQQGFLFLPLVIAIGILSSRKQESARLPSPLGRARRLPHLRGWLRWTFFGLGFIAVLVGMIAWDQARAQRPGFFQQSFVSYGGLRLAPLADLGDRASSWLRLLSDLWVSPWVNGLLLAAVLAWAVHGVVTALAPRLRHGSIKSNPSSEGQGAAGSTVLLLFVIAFLLAHWLLEIQVWDRYLLVLLPLLALLAARATVSLRRSLPSGRWQAALAPLLALVLAVGMSRPLVGALRGQVPVGGDHGAYDGIDNLAVYARENLPPGSVLYDHWLGYHYRFYLYGAPLHVHWYPDILDLVSDAQEYRKVPRYIAFPSWHDGTTVAAALAHAGIDLAPVYETLRRDRSVSFRLYRLVGP